MRLDIRHETVPDDQAEALVRNLAEDAENAFVIAQSFTEFKFVSWDGIWPVPFYAMFSGRLFWAEAEVRWVREDGLTHMWRIRESADGTFPAGERCEVKYYLWGRYQRKKFMEDIVPGFPEFPPTPRAPTDDVRRFIKAYEYFAPEPRDSSEDDLMDDLNQPRVIAYRLAGYDCGRDPRKKGAAHAA